MAEEPTPEEQLLEEFYTPSSAAIAQVVKSIDSTMGLAEEQEFRQQMLETIKRRKQEAAEFAQVTPEMILGSTAIRAYSSIDDCLDKHGNLDIEKARRTGAIHQIKKLSKTETKYGTNIHIEMYSNESAQDKLGNYLGMEKAPQQVNQKESLRAGIEEVARAIANGEEPSEEHKQLAFEQVKAWAVSRGALYSPEVIAEVAKEYS